MIAGTIECLETDRMVCERLRPEHRSELSELLLDPRVARTLWPHIQRPRRADVLHSLEERIAHWEHHGFGLWLLRDRRTERMVGRGGLQWTDVSAIRKVEAGWAIVPERWGQGLATELAFACLDVAFEDLGLGEVVAFTLPDNVASRRVMEKAGFEYGGNVLYAGLPHVLYRRARW